MKRIAITGSSGYLGGCLARHLHERDRGLTLFGLDVKAPKTPDDFEFAKLDMLDPQFHERLVAFAPDTIVHMAFVVPPMHNERRMREINVEGSRRVLETAAKIGVERLLVASSATALGAWPDNPPMIDDFAEPRGRLDFSYAAHKVALEVMTRAFVAEHPAIRVSWVRPCIVAGPHMQNYLRHALFDQPFVALLDGVDSVLQLVHEDDVSAACRFILERNSTGPFNLAPPDTVSMTEIAAASKRIKFKVAFSVAWWSAWFAWKIHFPLHEYPPPLLHYVRHSWNAAPNRLRNELGFDFQYSSRQTLDVMFPPRS